MIPERFFDAPSSSSSPRKKDKELRMTPVDAAGAVSFDFHAAADFLARSSTAAATVADQHQHHDILMSSSSAVSLSSSPALVLPSFAVDLPFMDLGKQLYENLDIGSSSGLLNNAGAKGPDFAANTELVVESIGHDLFVFLLASVIVTPICTKFLNVTPILGYLIIGAILGPHGGLDLFANSEGDVKLGDFGILFLLFSEGLEVSSDRLKKLLQYLPLGVAQISLVTLCLMSGILVLAEAVPDHRIISQFTAHIPIGIDGGPIEALVLALAATLSTSAFIFPVLKERGWEDEESGEAATSILLLQDLMVAPLLVLLPFLAGAVGSGDVVDGVAQNNYAAIGFLTAKATLGFGGVIYVGSLILQRVFALVAETGSAETFVALCLLVSAGMGEAAKMLGLTDTAGAFAAGVLLANTNYRAQIQADILPFKGILLGIFFMTAGSNFDVDLVIAEYPTIIIGALTLLAIKAGTLNLATRVPKWMEPNRLSPADALRVSLLLAGGGEFAFVVLALAEKLNIIPHDLASITTAIILITMGITPILGNIADTLSEPLALKAAAEKESAFTMNTYNSNGGGLDSASVLMTSENNNGKMAEQPVSVASSSPLSVAHDSVVICGYGEVGQSLVKALGKERKTSQQQLHNNNVVPSIVAFDLSPSLLNKNNVVRPSQNAIVLYGNGRNAEVIRSYGIETPSAIFVAYENFETVLDATTRLRLCFPPSVPIYTRASTHREAKELQKVGATQTVVESNELSRLASQLLLNQKQKQQSDSSSVIIPTSRSNSTVITATSSDAFISSAEADLQTLESLVSSTDQECVLSPTDDGCDDLSKGRVRTAASVASGITSLSKIDQLLEIYKSFDVDGSGFIDVIEIERVLDRSGKWIANDDEISRVNTWIEQYVTDTHPKDDAITAIELCCLYARAPEYVQRAFGLDEKKEKKTPIPQV